MNVWKFIKVNKEGALIGGGVGLAFYLYIKQQGVSLMSMADSKGLLDVMMSRSSEVAVIDAKLAVTCILLGVAIGMAADAMIKPRK